jgi:hypothetical protein
MVHQPTAPRGTFTLDASGTLSTQETARTVGISYVSLRRWLGSGGRGPFHKWLAKHKRAPLGYLFFGTDSRPRYFWRFSSENLRSLRQFIAERDCENRSQAASRREKAKKLGNVRKADKPDPKFSEAHQRYRAVLRDLRKLGFRPKDSELIRAKQSA